MNQRTLVDVPATPKLTPRQAKSLEFLRYAGQEGMTPRALGHRWHVFAGKHPEGRTCDYCDSTGLEILRALRRKGVARLRRVDGRTFWQATGLPVGTARGMLAAEEALPF